MQCIDVLDMKALTYLTAARFGAQDKRGNSGGLGELGISPQTIRAESGIPTNDGKQASVDRPVPAIRKPLGKGFPDRSMAVRTGSLHLLRPRFIDAPHQLGIHPSVSVPCFNSFVAVNAIKGAASNRDRPKSVHNARLYPY
ncbi:MAG: hypothetical protein BM559_10315 [Roseobacter sp. MedPE-SWchi]|nr:MAG: hypothetical protein BM559_10315 [Roseobacter sp. MedPE-SWchi]